MQPKINKTAIKINIGRSIKTIMGLSKVAGDITMEMDMGTGSINGKDQAMDLEIEIEVAASPLLDVTHLNPSALLCLY